MSGTHQVTLMACDGGGNRGVDCTVRTFNHCSSMLPWGGRTICLWHETKERIPAGTKVIPIPHLSYPQGCCAFYSKVFHELFVDGTSHMLYIQNDGYILNPDKWNDEWLAYDYVAAPWPLHPKDPTVRFDSGLKEGVQVGCGGFTLSSRKFNLALADLVRRGSDCGRGDVWACQDERPRLELEYGVRFAPVGVAVEFAIEHIGDSWSHHNPDNSFGFHGFLPKGVSNRRILL